MTFFDEAEVIQMSDQSRGRKVKFGKFEIFTWNSKQIENRGHGLIIMSDSGQRRVRIQFENQKIYCTTNELWSLVYCLDTILEDVERSFYFGHEGKQNVRRNFCIY